MIFGSYLDPRFIPSGRFGIVLIHEARMRDIPFWFSFMSCWEH